jgi:hypothetical protein
LALARTIRCASVDGAARNARAISSVVNPQTSRKVNATRASGLRAGWQQVKIKRSRSSSMLSSPNAGALADAASSRAAISACDASNRARRRKASMALKRPVEINQAAGFAGAPSLGHLSTASAKAS